MRLLCLASGWALALRLLCLELLPDEGLPACTFSSFPLLLPLRAVSAWTPLASLRFLLLGETELCTGAGLAAAPRPAAALALAGLLAAALPAASLAEVGRLPGLPGANGGFPFAGFDPAAHQRVSALLAQSHHAEHIHVHSCACRARDAACEHCQQKV